MGRSIVSNLKFKKVSGIFNPNEFANMLNDAYLSTKRPEQITTKTSFSPSSFGYGHGNCPRYWYLAFTGAVFIDENDAVAVANMAQGTQAHERLQDLIKKTGILIGEEVEIKNEYPPIKGFIDLVLDWKGEEILGEIKTAKQEIWDTRQSTMKPSANHMLQLLTYMKLKNVKESFFLYENKNTQEVLVIPVQMTDKNKEIIENLFSWLCEVYDNFKSGQLPTRPFTKSTSTCKHCPVKKECWAGPVGEIEIEPYEVPSI